MILQVGQFYACRTPTHVCADSVGANFPNTNLLCLNDFRTAVEQHVIDT